MQGSTRSVDEMEQEPINNRTMVGEFDWSEMSKAEVLKVLTELEKAKDTYTTGGMDVPYTLREKYREGSERLSEFHA